MLISICKSKIHRATITEADVNYEGSITIDSDLMNAADLVPYEKVTVANVTTGERLETYVIEGKSGSGVICLNGAAALKGRVGDIVIILAYGLIERAKASGHKPRIVKVDKDNHIV
jgi:aspartate 1-decarboxylase